MQERAVAMMFELIGSAMERRELSQSLRDRLTPALLDELYTLSKEHDVAQIVGAALDRGGLLDRASAIGAKFQKQLMLAVFRYEQLQYELNAIEKTLTEARIAFVPLKGSVLRAYYPEPWMRTSCDIDVLVHKEDLERAAAALIERLSYKQGEKGSHDVSFFSPSGVHLELHYELNDSEYRIFAPLTRVWESVTPTEEGAYRYAMPDPLFYFYHVEHMAKHFVYGGCGIRPLIDLWILDHKTECDSRARDALLEQEGLLTFAKTVRALSEVWLGDRKHDGQSELVEEYLLRGGVYGSLENFVAVRQQKQGGRLRYAMSRLFLPKDVMKRRYPRLAKHGWLLPFYQVRRWFDVAQDGRMKQSVQELSVNQTVSKKQRRQTERLLMEMGLQPSDPQEKTS